MAEELQGIESLGSSGLEEFGEFLNAFVPGLFARSTEEVFDCLFVVEEGLSRS